jgi:hypothetical protein
VPLPFIARENNVFIPHVWENAALFFIATLPNEPGARSPPFFFDAQVSWNIPEGGQPNPSESNRSKWEASGRDDARVSGEHRNLGRQ